jgi:hypothetical protein
MNQEIDNPEEARKYVESAIVLHDLADTAIEINDPPFVVRTATGAKVMAWLPVEEEDLLE